MGCVVGGYSLALGGGGDKIVMVCDGMGYKKIPALAEMYFIYFHEKTLVGSEWCFFLPSFLPERCVLVWSGLAGLGRGVKFCVVTML